MVRACASFLNEKSFFLYWRTRGVCAFSDNAFRETFVLLKFNDRPEIVPEGPHGFLTVFISITQNLPMMSGSAEPDIIGRFWVILIKTVRNPCGPSGTISGRSLNFNRTNVSLNALSLNAQTPLVRQ